MVTVTFLYLLYMLRFRYAKSNSHRLVSDLQRTKHVQSEVGSVGQNKKGADFTYFLLQYMYTCLTS
jgi:hypothetical protein